MCVWGGVVLGSHQAQERENAKEENVTNDNCNIVQEHGI